LPLSATLEKEDAIECGSVVISGGHGGAKLSTDQREVEDGRVTIVVEVGRLKDFGRGEEKLVSK
jgi:2-phospho-L-lactate transferase/gluconeogenesis factor (CofD/UPF0052 family)